MHWGNVDTKTDQVHIRNERNYGDTRWAFNLENTKQARYTSMQVIYCSASDLGP